MTWNVYAAKGPGCHTALSGHLEPTPFGQEISCCPSPFLLLDAMLRGIPDPWGYSLDLLGAQPSGGGTAWELSVHLEAGSFDPQQLHLAFPAARLLFPGLVGSTQALVPCPSLSVGEAQLRGCAQQRLDARADWKGEESQALLPQKRRLC